MTVHSVVINMGPHKTGSTAIAQYLTLTARNGALANSIVFPTGDLWFNDPRFIVKHEALANVLLGIEDRLYGTPTREALEANFAAIRDEAEGRNLPEVTTVLVAEMLMGAIDPDDLLTFLEKYFDRITLVIFCRKQDSAVSSMISQDIKMWNRPANSTELDSYLHNGLYYGHDFDYNSAMTRWSSVSSRCAVSFVPYAEGEEGTLAIVSRFFSAGGLGALPVSTPIHSLKPNRALSKACLDVMCSVKRQRDALAPNDSRLPLLEAQFADTLARFEFMEIAENRGSSFFDNPWVLSRLDRQNIQLAFEDSNNAFLRRIDQSPFQDEWASWADSVFSLTMAPVTDLSAGPREIFLDVTGLDEDSYPTMRSALSRAEAQGLTSLESVRYVTFDSRAEGFRIVSLEKHISFRDQHGIPGVVRRSSRSFFNGSRRRLRPLRFLFPRSGRHALRKIYESFLSETTVTTTGANPSFWPLWHPLAHHAVAFVVTASRQPHQKAQAIARSLAQTIDLGLGSSLQTPDTPAPHRRNPLK